MEQPTPPMRTQAAKARWPARDRSVAPSAQLRSGSSRLHLRVRAAAVVPVEPRRAAGPAGGERPSRSRDRGRRLIDRQARSGACPRCTRGTRASRPRRRSRRRRRSPRTNTIARFNIALRSWPSPSRAAHRARPRTKGNAGGPSLVKRAARTRRRRLPRARDERLRRGQLHRTRAQRRPVAFLGRGERHVALESNCASSRARPW